MDQKNKNVKRNKRTFRLKRNQNIKNEQIENVDIKKKFKNVWDDSSKKIIRTMIKDVVDVFYKNNDITFIFYGSLLGCARSGKIIPWDGDVDFFVSYKNQPNKSFDDLVSMGYKLRGSAEGCRRIYKEDGLANDKGWTWPWIDFYIYDICGDNVNFLSSVNKVFYTSKYEYVFPLKKCFFEEIEVCVPFVIEQHLDKIYPDWKNTYESPKIDHKMASRNKKLVRIPINQIKT